MAKLGPKTQSLLTSVRNGKPLKTFIYLSLGRESRFRFSRKMAEDNTGRGTKSPRVVVVAVDKSEWSEKAFDCEYSRHFCLNI